ncbi:MAG TPA: dockerin type I repeat-containing protein, partial [Gemmataceae bacterium]|nr:dockerin type I repeat-containing protein [Gemmataceae bacterium]
WFSTQVTFAGPAADAFLLRRDGDGAPVAFTVTTDVIGGVTVATLTGFTGAATEFGSLADGSYTLTAFAARISTPTGPLDGNGDGVGGDDYTFGAAQGLFRRYGDATGDGRVDAADLAVFRQTFGRIVGDPLYLSWLDVNGDGVINGIDLTRFRQAFGG